MDAHQPESQMRSPRSRIRKEPQKKAATHSQGPSPHAESLHHYEYISHDLYTYNPIVYLLQSPPKMRDGTLYPVLRFQVSLIT